MGHSHSHGHGNHGHSHDSQDHGQSHDGNHGHSHDGNHGHSHDGNHGHSHDGNHGHAHDDHHGHSHDGNHGHSHQAGFFDEAAANWDEKKGVKETAVSVTNCLVAQVPWSAEEWSQASVLDFGCGTGLVSIPLSSRVNRVVAIDASAGMIQRLREKLQQQQQQQQQQKVVALDAMMMTEQNKSVVLQANNNQGFDLIVTTLVLHHVDNVSQVISMLSSCLKPGGILAIFDLELTANSHLFHNAHAHKHAGIHHSGGFSAAELTAEFEKNHLDVIRSTSAFTLSKDVESDDHPSSEVVDFSIIGMWGKKL